MLGDVAKPCLASSSPAWSRDVPATTPEPDKSHDLISLSYAETLRIMQFGNQLPGACIFCDFAAQKPMHQSLTSKS
jgi:hypothetical protein